MAARRIGLVYGGGSTGLMGVVADAALDGGGHVVGVIPGPLVDRELAHTGLSQLRIVPSMHDRKAEMARDAGAFVALPGGLGTLEELMEIWTWAQLGIHDKPCGILNAGGYYDTLLRLIDHMVGEEFVPPVHRDLVIAETEPGRLLDRLQRFRGPRVPKWLDEDET
jgi:hypothetical protein